jgi:hypothetical protein
VKLKRFAVVLLLAVAACKEVPRTYSTVAGRGTQIFADDFNRSELGPDWHPTSEGITIENGRLQLENLQNHPVWLKMELPDDVRVDFDAWAISEEEETPEGDIKVEMCGDGKSYSTTTSYVASGYVIIFGGWKNTRNMITRRDEHGKDQVTSNVPKVEAGRRYHFTISREGSVLRWELDGSEILTFDDPDPLEGPGQSHFAFNGWEAATQFDNLVIEDLTQ